MARAKPKNTFKNCLHSQKFRNKNFDQNGRKIDFAKNARLIIYILEVWLHYAMGYTYAHCFHSLQFTSIPTNIRIYIQTKKSFHIESPTYKPKMSPQQRISINNTEKSMYLDGSNWQGWQQQNTSFRSLSSYFPISPIFFWSSTKKSIVHNSSQLYEFVLQKICARYGDMRNCYFISIVHILSIFLHWIFFVYFFPFLWFKNAFFFIFPHIKKILQILDNMDRWLGKCFNNGHWLYERAVIRFTTSHSKINSKIDTEKGASQHNVYMPSTKYSRSNVSFSEAKIRGKCVHCGDGIIFFTTNTFPLSYIFDFIACTRRDKKFMCVRSVHKLICFTIDILPQSASHLHAILSSYWFCKYSLRFSFGNKLNRNVKIVKSICINALIEYASLLMSKCLIKYSFSSLILFVWRISA